MSLIGSEDDKAALEIRDEVVNVFETRMDSQQKSRVPSTGWRCALETGTPAR